MRVIQDINQLCDRKIAGNKAATLAILKEAGLKVPPFFIVASPVKGDELPALVLQREIDSATHAICKDGDLVAVRSSSCEEDDEKTSFAGQFDTFLNVDRHDVLRFALKVAKSRSSAHIDTYRKAIGLTSGELPPAVLVQRMVRAEMSGVAFAADPVSGDTSVAVVAATVGTGESLVSGEVQGDTWRVNSSGKVLSREVAGNKGVLSDAQLSKVVSLVREVSKQRKKPQDIEWAFEDGRLYLLQSRDITTLTSDSRFDSYALWDNSNIVESYGGVTTPLTFSIARSAYQEAYRTMGRALGVSESAIRKNARAYEQMIGLIRGRVYYNLLNWYRLLMLIPGMRFNRRFMEQMMGVTEGVPAEAMPVTQDNRRFAALRATAGGLRVAERLVVKLFRHNSQVRRFHRALTDALQPIDLQALSPDQLMDSYEMLQARVIPAWKTPLINDLYCMIFHGALRNLCERWLDHDLAEIHNDLVSGESGIISVEPVRRMKDLAGMAAKSDRFVDALCGGDIQVIQSFIDDNQGFKAGYTDYLDHFGDRCLDELKLESETLNDNPLPLLRGVGQLARSGAYKSAGGSTDVLRRKAEEKIVAAFRGKPVRKRIFNFVLRLARARVRDRENLRFERTRVYGRVRAIFVEIGRRFVSLNVIGKVEDIFYLDVTEIAGAIRGTGISAHLSGIASNRQAEFAAYRIADDPPRRFITNGLPQLEASVKPLAGGDNEASVDSRVGQACSQGIVRGPVRIVRDPRNTSFRNGEILVAQRTDPGWVTIFPLVSGMIMERGSLLSHSAIVARELGIPAIVGVDDACRWLKDGDWVELNGASGVIRKINVAERAA